MDTKFCNLLPPNFFPKETRYFLMTFSWLLLQLPFASRKIPSFSVSLLLTASNNTESVEQTSHEIGYVIGPRKGE